MSVNRKVTVPVGGLATSSLPPRSLLWGRYSGGALPGPCVHQVRGGVFAVVAEHACPLLTYAELDGDTPILATAAQHCRALVYLLVHRIPSSLGQSDKLAAEVGDVGDDAAPDRVGGGRRTSEYVYEGHPQVASNSSASLAGVVTGVRRRSAGGHGSECCCRDRPRVGRRRSRQRDCASTASLRRSRQIREKQRFMKTGE